MTGEIKRKLLTNNKILNNKRFHYVYKFVNVYEKAKIHHNLKFSLDQFR